MSDDKYDDGLVHGHSWGREPPRREAMPHQLADASAARTPSTVTHDDRHMLHD